ncbi:MAG: 50S ribosomal protein L15 [Desulfobacteraceae bacterium]|jgi:large subunit ribosomal protein L15|nr:MAG: 50S ribosomal protein L15 [Deltaproteobacteria bacterium]TET94885.1 MAG: 50S ribosomal protein L15 [Desulfobacteraceae bacterium]
MKLNELIPTKGSRKKRKRIGRGKGSGSGETAGRGTKGQNSRSGGGVHLGFEGGQMPLQRRIPKRGFTNIFKKQYEIINIKDLKYFKSGELINSDTLLKSGLLKKARAVKLLGEGDISYPLKIKVNKVSQAAKEKIESAGGKVEIG